jgi:hypothetical protein
MLCTLTLDGSRSPDERRRLLTEVAAALNRAGVGNVLVDWTADGMPGWPEVVAADPMRIVSRVTYGAALDGALAALGTVDWEPAGPGDPDRDRAVYRIAVSLDGPVAISHVVLACLNPDGYLGRHPYTDDGPCLPVSALYAGLVEVGVLVGVDWKSSRMEAAGAVGGLLVVPDARERLADVVPGYPMLLGRCDAGDRADRGSAPALPADDPLRAVGQQPEAAVATEVAALADAASIVLLRLDNGDTPGYLAVRADRAAQWLDLTTAAGLPVDRV